MGEEGRQINVSHPGVLQTGECGCVTLWLEANVTSIKFRWMMGLPLLYILLSSVSKDIPTDPTHRCVIRAAFLASTGQHVLLLFVVVVVLLFLSKRVSITMPSAIPPTNAPTASRPFPDPSIMNINLCKLYTSATCSCSPGALADTIGLDTGRREAQEGTECSMGLIWKFLRSDAVKALASDFNGSRLALTPSTLP